MKATIVFLLVLFATRAYSTEPEILEIRNLFEASANNKASADQLLKLLSGTTQSASPLLICYQGATEMMLAKYAFNPINKLKKFTKGKSLIEEAVKKEPQHLEIRFLRFAIQTNLPAFLNYNDDIQMDKKYLLDNLKTTKDNILKQNIMKYLSTSKYCSAEEKKGLVI